MLSWVTTGPNLRSANLITSDDAPYISSKTLLKTIQRETIGNFIQSLTIHVDDIPDVLLMAINSRFTHIKFLKMYASRVNEDRLVTSAMSNFPPDIETVDLDLWHLSSKMNRMRWIKHAFVLKRGLFDNYPSLRRATCTICERYPGFDWRRGDKIVTSKFARGVKTVAYVSGILRDEDT